MDEITDPAPPVVPDTPDVPSPVSKKGTLQLFKDSWKSFSRAQKSQLIAVLALVLALPTLLGGVYAVKLYRSGAATPPVTPPYTTPTPGPQCNTPCNTDSDCYSGLVCYKIGGVTLGNVVVAGYCRKPQCMNSTNCLCSTPPPPTRTPIPTPIVDCYTCNQNNQCVFDAGCKMVGPRCGANSCPISTPTPTIKPTPTPTPKITCKTGVNSFAVNTPCTGGYRYMTFTCYDGYSQKEGGPTSCKSSSTWSSNAASLCAGRSNCTPTPTPRPIPTVTPIPTPIPTPVCRLKLFGFCLIR